MLLTTVDKTLTVLMQTSGGSGVEHTAEPLRLNSPKLLVLLFVSGDSSIFKAPIPASHLKD